MKTILSILTLAFILNFPVNADASEGTCMQGYCNNGYGIFIFNDGRVYEGQWKKGLFDGMGKLTFISGSKYTGEFKKGLMHGYGKISLPNGSEKRCEAVNGEIQVDELTRQLWIKQTTSEVEEHIVFLKIGDVYKAHRNYEKSLEYYNKLLAVNPDHSETVTKKKEVENKIAELEAKAKAKEPPKIVIEGTTMPEQTIVYGGRGGGGSSSSRRSSSASSGRGYHVPSKVDRLMKAGMNQGHHLSPGPVITTDAVR